MSKDTIDRQAAIDYFVTNVGFHDEDGYPIEDECELREIWTGYFDGIPSAQTEKCTEGRAKTHACDSISRQAAIEKILGQPPEPHYPSWYAEQIKELLPAEPKRIRAKWIATTSLQEGQITWRDYKCSNCSHHRSKPMNYCEVCGAKMER